MDFYLDDTTVKLPLGPGPISAVTSADLKAIRNPHCIALIIDALGVASARAQGLKSSITNFEKFLTVDSSHRLYIAHGPIPTSPNSPMTIHGFLKIGVKRLFFLDASGGSQTISPTCALDFYVHESCRRTGHGHAIFEAMLAAEHLAPYRLAYDRPSHKFLSFLARHYALREFVPQANRFVIFDEYGLGSTDPANDSDSSSSSSCEDFSQPASPTSSLDSETLSPISTSSAVKSLQHHREYCQRALWGCNPLLGSDDEPGTPKRRAGRGMVFGM